MTAETTGTTRRTVFHEVMEGTIRLTGETSDRPIVLELTADLPRVLNPLGDIEGVLSGRALVGSLGGPQPAPATAAAGGGWAADPRATGMLRVAPVAARRIRYRLDFTAADGRMMRLDGWKSIDPRHPVRSMTTLPATVTDGGGAVVGTAVLRFRLRRDLLGFLAGFRFPKDTAGAGRAAALDPATPDAASALRTAEADAARRSRWKGRPHRLEVWYTTITDQRTGTGVWLHHELVAPADGEPPTAHGWAAVFPPGEKPVLGRFGPAGWSAPEDGFAAEDVVHTAGRHYGSAGPVAWDLTSSGGGAPLLTFPRWAWERELLPAAQIVPEPTARFDGTVRFAGRELVLSGAPGGNARIYGHGNARRWAWLHADLGGGDVCEVVAAVSTRPGLDRLPPLPFVRLRVGGRERPGGDPLLAALRLRARVELPTWSVRGRLGDRLIDITVTLPPLEAVTVDYTDPDGAPAVCHNSERADAVIRLYRRTDGGGRARDTGPDPAADGPSPAGARRWLLDREWRLEGTAHAEVGLR